MKIKKTFLVLFLIVVLAFILRFMVAQTVEIVPDEIVYSLLPWKIISAQRLSTVEGGPLFSYLIDIGYTVFGEVNATSTRLPSIFFGSLTVILVYLFSLKMFDNKKAALFSSLLFALSGYALENNTEPDMTAFFFAFLSMYFFLFFLEGKRNYLYLSTISLTLAILCKSLPLLFLSAYLLVFVFHAKGYFSGNQNTRIKIDIKLLKTIFGCLTIAVLLLMPAIMYNYLEFKNNGKTENIVSTFLGVGEHFHPGNSQIDPWSFQVLKDLLKSSPDQFFYPDPIIIILGIIGTVLLFSRKIPAYFLLLLSLLSLVFYMGGITGSKTHYLFIPLALSIFAGYTVERISNHLKAKFKIRWAYFGLVLIIVIFSLFQFYTIVSNKSANMQLREYVVENVPRESIIVMDPRIYFGNYAWILNERHYLNGIYFQKILDQIAGSAGSKIEVPFYYIECSGDTTCGWKIEDYERITPFAESLTEYMKKNLVYAHEIDADHHFFIHRGTIAAPLSVLQSIDSTHVFWGYSIGWESPENNIDNYLLEGSNKFFHMVGLFFLYLDLLLALIAIPLLFLLLWKSEEK